VRFGAGALTAGFFAAGAAGFAAGFVGDGFVACASLDGTPIPTRPTHTRGAIQKNGFPITDAISALELEDGQTAV
jgi:hypothetical protein